jgi:hypothetical protein
MVIRSFVSTFNRVVPGSIPGSGDISSIGLCCVKAAVAQLVERQ